MQTAVIPGGHLAGLLRSTSFLWLTAFLLLFSFPVSAEGAFEYPEEDDSVSVYPDILVPPELPGLPSLPSVSEEIRPLGDAVPFLSSDVLLNALKESVKQASASSDTEKSEDQPSAAAGKLDRTPAEEGELLSEEDAGRSSAGSGRKVRELTVREGDDVFLLLDGSGWIFLGERNGEKGLEFRSRKLHAEQGEFVFQAVSPGMYTLDFQRQLLSTGGSLRETVQVTVLDRESGVQLSSAAEGVRPQVKSAVAEQALLPETDVSYPAETEPVPPAAEELYQQGRYTEALSAYLEGYDDNDPALNARIAELYTETGRTDEGLKYLAKNLDADPEYREAAVRGIASAALESENGLRLSTVSDSLLLLSRKPDAEFVLKSAEILSRGGYTGHGIRLLERFREYEPNDERMDQVLFLLATLYEQEGASRSMKKALTCYGSIESEFPFSGYRDRARERKAYLDRHFFSIR